MAHDLVVRFDELDHVSSRLGQTAGELLISPTGSRGAGSFRDQWLS